MATKVKSFSDGGQLNVEYGGSGNGSAVFSADANEGKDRNLTVNLDAKEGEASASVEVTQYGRREEFVAGDNFYASDGEFLVLK